ncbi:MAG: hypothetical protein ACXWDN_12155 [Limisphaerales bacterium]
MSIAALALLGFGTVAFFVLRSGAEPEYDGKPLSYWLEILNRDKIAIELADSAQNALRHIGTNAYPQVIGWTAYEPPNNFVLNAATRWNWRPLNKIMKRDQQRKYLAFAYFHSMGPRASTAVPMLSNIVVSAQATMAYYFARDDLEEIGPEGYATIVAIMQNTNLPTGARFGCLTKITDKYLATKLDRAAEAEWLRQPLLQCIRDPDIQFRTNATKWFQKRAPDLLTNSPASN